MVFSSVLTEIKMFCASKCQVVTQSCMWTILLKKNVCIWVFFMNTINSVLLVDLSCKSHMLGKDRSWFTRLILMISDDNYQWTIYEDLRFCDLAFVISSCCWNSGRLFVVLRKIYLLPPLYICLFISCYVEFVCFLSYFSQPVFCLMQSVNALSVQTMWCELVSCKKKWQLMILRASVYTSLVISSIVCLKLPLLELSPFLFEFNSFCAFIFYLVL